MINLMLFLYTPSKLIFLSALKIDRDKNCCLLVKQIITDKLAFDIHNVIKGNNSLFNLLLTIILNKNDDITTRI